MLLSVLMEETVRNKLIQPLGQISQMNPDRKLWRTFRKTEFIRKSFVLSDCPWVDFVRFFKNCNQIKKHSYLTK